MRISLLVAVCICLITGCKEWDYPQSFPLVFTEAVENISSEGAEFVGTVESLGSDQTIIQYGFVWNMSGTPTLNSSQVAISEKIDKGLFSKIISNDLLEGKVYYVRAFIQTDKLIIYGNEVKFLSKGSKPPAIVDFSPKAGFDGTEISIIGANFSANVAGNVVTLGALKCEVISATDSLIKIKSPVTNLVGDYFLSITVAGKTTPSAHPYSILGPRIKSISKLTGRVGDLLTVNGEYFNITDYSLIGFGEPQQFVNNVSSPYVISTNEIECYVPDNPNTTAKVQINGYINTTLKTFISPYNFTILNSWNKRSDQTPLGWASGFSSAVVDGHLYFVGGKLLYEFSPSTGTWIQRAGFPGFQRYHGSVFVLNNKLYYGFGEASFDGGYFGDIWKYDPITNAWEFVMNTPIPPRSRMVSFVVNNKAYVGFGFARAGSNGLYYDDFWQFDPVTLEWTEIQSPIKNTNKTLYPISFELGDKGYVAGVASNEVWQFDPLSFAWVKKKDFTGEFGGPVTASETSAFVFSGSQYGGGNRVFEYDATRDRWIKRQTFPGSGRHSAVAAWMNGKVYFGTGEYTNANSYTTDLWELSL